MSFRETNFKCRRCEHYIIFLAAFCHLTAPIFSVIIDAEAVKTIDVQAVEGMVAELPCDVTSALHDKVHMVFWFRDDAGIPLYSFDVRGVSMNEGKHWSSNEVFGPRAHFRPTPQPAALLIEDIKRHDEGVYRCRVDYRNSQTTSFRYNLTVIVPPGQPLVAERTGGLLNATRIGPKEEGDDLALTCTVRGGKPPPTVRWLVNSVLVDVEYEHNTGDVIENRLSWPGIGRQDLGSIFTCQAVNSILIKPKEASFVLDMNLKPLTVEISKITTPLSAEQRYTVTCNSTGSRPTAIITWYKGKRQLKRTKEESRDNVTISELSFVPTTEDHGRPLTCRAENPNLTQFLETTWKLDVVYPPQVSLRLGSTLSAEDIKEGDDVYFECHVHSNPPSRKLSWMHNGVLVQHNASARVVRSNQSLVLQRVARHSAGKYTCSATNPEGETVSNEFNLRVKFAPVCRQLSGNGIVGIGTGVGVLGGSMAVGAGRGERVLVVCEVDADPPATSFKWKFNNSGETLDVPADRYTSNGSVSILRYTPIADLDFGTLSCTATNDVGHQVSPCIYQIVAAGRPQPVTNCSLGNLTSGIAEISCEPGFDGGLPQHFLLEVYNEDKKEYIYNTTGSEAIFSIALETGVSLRLEVYAVNSKGRSSAVTLSDLRLGDPEKQAAASKEGPLPAGMGVLLGAAVSLVLLGICALLATIKARKSRRQSPASTATSVVLGKGLPVPQHDHNPAVIPQEPKRRPPTLLNSSSNDMLTDDRDPDVIPAHYEPPALYARTWGANSSSPKEYPTELAVQPCSVTLATRPSTTVTHFITDNSSLNVQAFKEKLLDTRLPESCV